MKSWFFTSLIAVIFISCSEQGTKIPSYDLVDFVEAEGIGTRDVIQSIVNGVRTSDNPDAICDAVQKEIDKFKSKVRPVLGEHVYSVYIPPRDDETASETAIRRRAIKLYRAFLSSFGDAEDVCRAIAKHGDNYLGSF